nr:immunoglobulin heavy chain junction region [Macaca mulatta]
CARLSSSTENVDPVGSGHFDYW